MDETDRQENEFFESEVRRIARELWPSAMGTGPVIVDGQERDGIFETEECIHIVEATTSRREKKAQDDVKKFVSLASKLQRRNQAKAVKCWFVTREDPTADQRSVIDKHTPLITAVSFGQFQAKLIDSRAYLSARDNYPFGSVRDPATGSLSPKIDYIPLDLINVVSREPMSTPEILTGLGSGHRIVILGDYGAGKSMTLRYLYQEIRRRHLKGQSALFPVYLNLRDHFGQSDPGEILERHAKTIGFANPHHLVRAWRAGYVVLLLDGFDEVTTIGIQGLWKKLQDNRYRAMEPVRRFVRDHPSSVGVILAGRAHFFDSERERRHALGLSADFAELSLVEFTDDQIRAYLEKTGLSGVVPQWLPSRPLLLGYLASKGLLHPLASGEPLADPAAGWNRLLDDVSDREAQIEAGIDGRTIRRILERLATKARSKEGGLGPLSADDIVGAFKDICGYSPDERGMILLQRLPGLGIDRADEETRAFIDEDFADVCRAGDVVEFIAHPYDSLSVFQAIECGLLNLGIEIASLRVTQAGVSSKQLNAALQETGRAAEHHLMSDLCRIVMTLGIAIESALYIKGIYIQEIDFSVGAGDLSRVHFQDCFFTRVGLDTDVSVEILPKFERCYVGELDGRISQADLPSGVFDAGCVVDEFITRGETTDALLSLDLPLGTKVLLTILKKLYHQRGSGRRETALHRGLDHRARRLVPNILRVLESDNLAIKYRRGDNTVWLPERTATRRVGRIVASPTNSSDPVVIAVSTLS